VHTSRMKKGVAAAAVLTLLSGITLGAPAKASSTITTYKLLWADDFNGKKGALPNPKTWIPELGGLNQNGELEYYTKDSQNIGLDGSGHLLITANRIADSSLLAVIRCSMPVRPASSQVQKSKLQRKFPSSMAVWRFG